MGGNGFYWRVSYPPAHPGMLELRRAEDGTRAWVEAAGEYYHSSTGEYGGLWRRQGRAPNALVGVGFVAQGFDRASYYRRTAASHDPRARFIFEGVEGDVLGDFGIAGDGAAGLELDAFNAGLGSPSWALVVASSEDHSNAFQLVNEEMNVSFAGSDGRFSPAVRADMVFYEHPGGGAVFGHRLHRVRGQSRPPGLRQRHRAADPERPASVPGSHPVPDAVIVSNAEVSGGFSS
jgi:N,N-dimethylformamidase